MKTIKPAKIRKDEELKALAKTVGEIIDNVKANGDAALIEYNKKFDQCERTTLRISKEEIQEAYSLVDDGEVADIRAAAANIEAFAEDFDVSVYVDGNVQPVSDLSYYAKLIDSQAGFSMHRHRVRDTIAEEAIACKALGKGNATALDVEVDRYVSEGFPLEFGLLETNIVATDLKSDIAHHILSAWWDTMSKAGSGRDQISLPYVLWTYGVPIDAVATMGRNPYRDTKIFINNHK